MTIIILIVMILVTSIYTTTCYSRNHNLVHFVGSVIYTTIYSFQCIDVFRLYVRLRAMGINFVQQAKYFVDG